MTKIVVGVDGSESSQEALRWAVAEAKLHGQPLEALMAWGYLDQHHVPADVRHFEPDYDEADAREALAQYVTDVLGPDASDAVALRPTCDLPARALLDAGKDAAMLVVGARGRGGFASLLLGSVSQKVLHHATCPVAVIRAGQEPNPEARRGSHRRRRRRVAERVMPLFAGRSTRGAGARASVEVVHAWHMPFVAPYPYVTTDVRHRHVREDRHARPSTKRFAVRSPPRRTASARSSPCPAHRRFCWRPPRERT